MNNTYQLENIVNIRGFKALTQEEVRIDNINKLSGKKTMGFNKTRKEVLTEEFDREALNDLVNLAVDVHSMGILEQRNNVVTKVAKNLCERVFRDFVPLDMVETFGLAIVNTVNECDSNRERAMNIIQNYFTCGVVVPVTQTFREKEEEVKEWRILYFEPRKRTV